MTLRATRRFPGAPARTRACDSTRRRIAPAPADTLCQTVPSDPLQKYKVDCNGGNTGGAISFCDANCQNCNVVNFNNGELLLR